MSAESTRPSTLSGPARVAVFALAALLAALFVLPAAAASAESTLDKLRRGTGGRDIARHPRSGGGGYHGGYIGDEILFWYLVFGMFYQQKEYRFPDAPYQDSVPDGRDNNGYLIFTGRWDPMGPYPLPENAPVIDSPPEIQRATGWEWGYQNYDFSDDLGFTNVTGLAFHAKMRSPNGIGFTYDYLHLREFDDADVEIDRLSLTHGTFDIGLVKTPNVLWDIGFGWGQINGEGLSGPSFGTGFAIFPFKPVSIGWRWTATSLADDDDPTSTTSSTIFDRVYWVGVHIGRVEVRWTWRQVDVDNTSGLLKSSGFGVTLWF